MERMIQTTPNDAVICCRKKYTVFLRESIECPVQVVAYPTHLAARVSHVMRTEAAIAADPRRARSTRVQQKSR